MSSAVHAWMAAYADHLEAGHAALLACGSPDAEWMKGCQDFDDQLRSFDGEAIGRAASVGPGPDLVTRVREARAQLDAAFGEQRTKLQEQLQATVKGRKGLRGYDDAGRRMTQGSALYLERRY